MLYDELLISDTTKSFLKFTKYQQNNQTLNFFSLSDAISISETFWNKIRKQQCLRKRNRKITFLGYEK